MIHDNVRFSFKDNVSTEDQLQRVHAFLADLKSREKIHDFRLLKRRGASEQPTPAEFQALIVFKDNDQFAAPFAEVSAIGVHAGKHGFMIENVNTFVVEVFEELPETAIKPR